MALQKIAESSGTENVFDIIAPPKRKNIPMGINPQAMGLIVNLLTDLYPDAILSLVREVVSNAIDATKRLTVDTLPAIRISTPTSLNPVFVVEDSGVGMSATDVEEIYSQYGVSTKANDFTQTGAFGLGAKSPLAYCNEFHVTTTKDGITTYFVVARKPEGNVTSILDEKFTGRASGTTISIPSSPSLKDLNEFDTALNAYKKFSVDVPLVIDDVAIDSPDNFELFGEMVLDEETNTTGRVWVDRAKFNDNMVYLLRHGSFNPTINYLLSGWTYQQNSTRWNPASIVVELKPGVVDFSSSRDSITRNDRFYDLEKRVKEQYSTLNENLLQKIMATYRKLNVKDAIKFLWDAPLKVQEDDIVVLETSPRHFSAEVTPTLSLTMDDFTLDNGFSPLRTISENSRENAYCAVPFTGENGKDYGIIKITDGGLTASDARISVQYNCGRYTDTTNLILSRMENKSLDSVVKLVYGCISSFEGNKIIVVTGMDTETAVFIGKNRLLLARTLFHETNVVLLRGKLNSKEKADLTMVYPEGFSTISAKELVEKTTESRIAARKARVVGPKGELEVFGLIAHNGMKKHSEYDDGYAVHFSEKISEIINNDDVIILTAKDEFDGWKNTFFGAVNNGAVLTNKQIYVIDRSSIRAAHLVMLANYENVYLSSKFSHVAKAATPLIQNRRRHGVFLVESTAELTESEVVALWKKEISSVSSEVWVKMEEIAREGTELKRILGMLATANDPKNASKFRGMVETLLTTKFDSATATGLKEAVFAMNRMVATSWNSNYRTDMIRFTLKSGNESFPVVYNAVMAEVYATLEVDFEKKTSYTETVVDAA